MARMTATDIVGIMRKALGNPTTTEISDDRLLRAFNLAQADLVCEKPERFPELRTSTTISTVASTATYELTVGDVVKIESARDDTNNQRIRPCDPKKMVKLSVSTSTATIPIYFAEDGRGSNDLPQVQLWPTPSTSARTIRFYYYQLPTEIVLSPAATSPVTAQRWDRASMERGTQYALVWVTERDEAAAQAGIADNAETRMRRTGPLPPEVKYYFESVFASTVE